MYTIYMHKNKSNQKVYIGITSQTLERRWQNGHGYSSQYFARAIAKYGWDGFEHIVLETNLSEDVAKQKEIELISKHKSTNPEHGYNITSGGDGVSSKPTQDAIDRMRESLIAFYAQDSYTNRQMKKVIYDGVEYKSLNAVSQAIGVSSGTIRNWIDGSSKKPSWIANKELRFAEQYDSKHLIPQKTVGTKVVCDGIEYETIKSCASHYNVQPMTMKDWLSGVNPMPDKFKELGLRYSGKVRKKANRRTITCDNKTYENIETFSKEHNLKPSTVMNWLRCDRAMPEEYIKLQLRYTDSPFVFKPKREIFTCAKKVECNGIVYNSIVSCAKAHDVTNKQMGNWLNKPEKMPQKFVDLGLKFV